MNTWKYALSTADTALTTAPILLVGSPEDNLVKAAALGYQAIEIHTRQDAALNFSALERICRETGVAVSAIVTGRLNTEGACSLISAVPYVAAFAESGMRQYIDMAAQLRADIVIGWAKGRMPASGDPASHLDRLARVLRRLAAYAAERGVRLHLEVVNRYEVNFLSTAEGMAAFLRTYQLDNCYVHLDTFHMGIEESDPVEAIACCGDRLGYMHLSDNTRRYPGSGQFDFLRILTALEDVGYQGYLSVECLPEPSGEAAAARALAYLRETHEQLHLGRRAIGRRAPVC